MSDPDELTPKAAPIPMWIESAVTRAMGRALEKIDKGCAEREERMLESEKRIIAALDNLGLAELRLAQKANEAGVRSLRDELDSCRMRIAELEQWRRDTQPCPPPFGAE
jgi:hypothetical protein